MGIRDRDGSSLEYRASVDPGQDPTNGAIAATGSNGFAASGQAQQTQGLRGIDLSSQAGAWEGLQRIDSAIDTVSRSRATLGAVQNRFESAIANISIQNENAVQSRGRMVDANFAKEISNQTRSMILQEMGFAMQAQANQSSRWTLALLRYALCGCFGHRDCNAKVQAALHQSCFFIAESPLAVLGWGF